MPQMLPTNSFIAAKISRARLVSEESESAEQFPETGTFALAEKGRIEIVWLAKDKGPFQAELFVSPEIECTLYADSEEKIKYKCKYEVCFGVTGFVGFAPSEDVPEEATAPYVDMALFLARAHATKTIQSLGAHRFTFNNPIDAKGIAEKAISKETRTPSTSAAVKRRAKPKKPKVSQKNEG